MRDSIMTYLRRLATLGAVMAVLVVMAAPAGAQAPEETGQYSGAGVSSILEVNVNPSGLPIVGGLLGGDLVNLALAPTRQGASTQNNLTLPGGTEGGGILGGVLGGGDLLGGLVGGGTGGLLGGLLGGDGGDGGDGTQAGNLFAFGEGSNIETIETADALLDGVLANAISTAPPDNGELVEDELVDVQPTSLIGLEAARAEAQAFNIGENACPDDRTVARGFTTTANAQVLPTGDLLGGDGGAGGILGGLLGGTGGGGLLGLDTGVLEGLLGGGGGLLGGGLGGLLGGDTNGGTGDGTNQQFIGDSLVTVGETVSSETLTRLVGDDPSALGVQSAARADLTGLGLLGGAVEVGVASPIVLTATATGQPGGATVEYSDPVVTVNGDDALGLINLLGLGGDEGLLGGTLLGDLLNNLGIAELLLNVERGSVDVNEAGDGTSASATASLLTIEVLALGDLTGNLDLLGLGDLTSGLLGDPEAGEPAPLIRITVGEQHVEANAPAGGVDCGPDEEEPPPEQPTDDEEPPMPVTGGGALAVAGMSILLAGSVLHRRRNRS